MLSLKSSPVLAACAATFMACNGPDNLSSNAAPSPRSTAIVGAASHNTDEVSLKLAYTGDVIDSAMLNQVKLSGRGKDTAYQVLYDFDSGISTRFKLLQLNASIYASGCKYLPQPRAFLRGGETSQEIFANSPLVELQPRTHYTLEVTQEQDCDSVTELVLGVVAWSEQMPTESPELGRVCQGLRGDQYAFFPINGATGYTGIASDHPFLDDGDFCGETYSQIPSKCEFDGGDGLFSNHVSCISGPNQEHSFELSFNPADGSGSFDCKAGEKMTFTEILSRCQEKVLDLNAYRK